MDDDFQRYVTLERASRVTGRSVNTLKEWRRKGLLRPEDERTNGAGKVVLVDIERVWALVTPRPRVTVNSTGSGC